MAEVAPQRASNAPSATDLKTLLLQNARKSKSIYLETSSSSSTAAGGGRKRIKLDPALAASDPTSTRPPCRCASTPSTRMC